MILSTTESLPGRTVDKVLGVVSGNIVKAKSVSGPIVEGLKKLLSQSVSLGPSIITGEEDGIPKEPEKEAKGNVDADDLSAYTDLLKDLRAEALARMQENAVELKADAVVGIRFCTHVIMLHAFEVMVYGTAVKLT
jgi:uncharacterized protein YbjQ (UPF0145 family)